MDDLAKLIAEMEPPRSRHRGREGMMACYIEPGDHGPIFICGRLGPHCAEENCGRVGDLLCDYPVGDGKTCDRPLCPSHATEVGPDLHYCIAHAEEWWKFRAGKGDVKLRRPANDIPATRPWLFRDE